MYRYYIHVYICDAFLYTHTLRRFARIMTHHHCWIRFYWSVHSEPIVLSPVPPLKSLWKWQTILTNEHLQKEKTTHPLENLQGKRISSLVSVAIDQQILAIIPGRECYGRFPCGVPTGAEEQEGCHHWRTNAQGGGLPCWVLVVEEFQNCVERLDEKSRSKSSN